MLKELFIILISAIFIENFILSKFLGLCPFLGVSKRLSPAIGMGGAVVVVMTIATIITYFLNVYVLKELGLEYLQLIVFILVISSVVQFLEIFIKKFSPVLYKALGVFLPLITTNCAILGVVIINDQRSYDFIYSLIYALGAGIGFTFALAIFAGIREKLENSDVPESFRGLPISLIAAGLISMIFIGFKGMFQ